MNLLLAAVLLLQDKTAEETFKKIEDQIEKAKTLALKFDVKPVKAIGGEESVLKGTILLKNGNRMRCDFSMHGGGSQRWLFVSDGSKVAGLKVVDGKEAFADGRNPEKKETSKDFNANLTAHITRAGAMTFIPGILSLFTGGGLNLKIAPSVTEIKTGEDDGNLKTLSYKTVVTSLAAQPATIDVRLWYEPKSLRLVKRTIRDLGDGESRIFNETYEEFTLNADIPDDKFKLPEEKK